MTDVDGRRYLDLLAGYSALNFGHRHPRLVAAAIRQLGRATLVSRAFDHDQFGPFCAELADLCGMDMVLPMNTGAEAVETAIKVARKWAYERAASRRTRRSSSCSTGTSTGGPRRSCRSPPTPTRATTSARTRPGFVSVPYGDLPALEPAFQALGRRIAAVLVEPIQGEAGAWSCRRPASSPGCGRCAPRPGR